MAGQFVMVRPASMRNRSCAGPFSVFEVIRDRVDADRPSAFSTSARAGQHSRLYDAGTRRTRRMPWPAWPALTRQSAAARSLDGGRRRRPGAICHARRDAGLDRHADDAVLRRPLAPGAVPFEFFERLGVKLVLTTEDGSAGRARARHARRSKRALRALSQRVASWCTPAGRNRCSRPCPAVAARHGQTCEVSVERTMGCGLGGCYSCVIKFRQDGQPPHFVRSCIAGPVFDGADIVWD